MKARLLGKRPLSFPLRMNLQGDFIHCLLHFINHFSNRVHQLLDKTSHLNASDVFQGLHENQPRNVQTIQISYPSDPTLSILRNHSVNYFLSSLCWAKQRPQAKIRVHQSTKLQSFCLFKGGFFFSPLFLSSNPLRGFHWDDESLLCAHQCELIAVQLSGPVGFRAIAIHQSLLTVDLVLRLPSGEALRGRGGDKMERSVWW